MGDAASFTILIVAGFLAGIVNTIAGGGSFLTLPALMFFGLDPQTANATNRVAILFSSGSAAWTFHKQGHLDRQLAQQLTLPTIAGVPIGALLAIYLPANAFEPIFGIIFLAMAIVLICNPKRIADANSAGSSARLHSPAGLRVAFFAIGIYVGFIQAGMGILVLSAMGFLNSGDLVASNGVKNWLAFLVTLAALTFFVVHGLVDWVPGLVMAIGNLIGGIIGAKLAIKKGNRLIFGFLVVVMTATGMKLLVPPLIAIFQTRI